MGFFDRLKAVFTRKAAGRANEGRSLLSRSRSARKASATRSAKGAAKFRAASEASAQRKRSEAWKGSRAAEIAKAQSKLNAEFAKAMNKAEKSAGRRRAGEARAAATRKARENAVAAALKKAPNAQEWEKNFRENLAALKEGRSAVRNAYRPQGSVRKSGKLRNTPTKKANRNKSLKAAANNWNFFAPPAPTKKEMTKFERNLANINFRPAGKNWNPFAIDSPKSKSKSKTPNLIQFSKAQPRQQMNPFD
jgi:hypothetical protein